MYNTPWTEREIDKAAWLWLDGRTDEYIAKRTGRTESAVKSMRQRYGVVSCRRKQKKWTTAERNRVARDRRRGVPVREIAECYGVSVFSIYSVLRRLNRADEPNKR